MQTSPCVPCCTPNPQVVNIPGISGADGADGSQGIDAFTLTTQNFVVPAVGAAVGVSVAQSSWMVVGQNLIMTGPANFLVVATPTTTSATLQFLGYPGDVVPGTVIGAGATVSPAGIIGGGWNCLNQKQDQAIINSNVLTNSANLQFQMAANTNYRIRGVVFFDTTAAGGFQYDFTAPGAPTLVRFQQASCKAGATAAFTAGLATVPGTTVLGTGGVDAGTTKGFLAFDAIFQNGANAALFAFQFSQNVATVDTGAIVRAGSYIDFSIVN